MATKKTASRLGVLPSFSPISLHDLLRVTSDGFKPNVLCFLLLGLPILRFALWDVVFCLNFGLFFFSSLVLVPLTCVFPLFIYLQ